MKSVSVCLLFALAPYFLYAQNAHQTGVLTGRFVSTANTALPNIEVTIPRIKLMTTTDGDGQFVLPGIPYGKHTLVVSNGYSIADTIYILVDKEVIDIATVMVEIDEAAVSGMSYQMPTIALEENAISADGEGISDQ